MSTNNYKFKQTEIGEIPQDWDIDTINNISEKVGIGPFGSSIKVETFTNIGMPIISGQHLNKIHLEDNTFNFITNEHAIKLKNSIVRAGDIIFTHAGNVGQVSYIPSSSKYSEYIISQRQFYLRCDKNKAIPEFVTYYFYSPTGQYLLLSNKTQTGVPSIAQPVTHLRRLFIPLPPIREQQKIVSFLSSLDNKIELNQKTIKTLEEIGQTLFKKWFADFDFPNEKCEPYKSSGGEMIESELGEIPKGWSVKKISDFGKVICGKTPSKDRDEYFNGDTPFIKIPDMHGNMFITETTDSLTKLGADSQPSKYLPKNSICISCIATVGLVSLTSKESQTNQQINSLILNEEYYKEYLFFTLKNSYDFLNNLASGGSATLNMNTQTFSNIEILKPNKEILLSFHENLSPIFEKILNLQNENISIKNTRDFLLPKLLSGKIRV